VTVAVARALHGESGEAGIYTHTALLSVTGAPVTGRAVPGADHGKSLRPERVARVPESFCARPAGR
jgi:hypothetical protein